MLREIDRINDQVVIKYHVLRSETIGLDIADDPSSFLILIQYDSWCHNHCFIRLIPNSLQGATPWAFFFVVAGLPYLHGVRYVQLLTRNRISDQK